MVWPTSAFAEPCSRRQFLGLARRLCAAGADCLLSHHGGGWFGGVCLVGISPVAELVVRSHTGPDELKDFALGYGSGRSSPHPPQAGPGEDGDLASEQRGPESHEEESAGRGGRDETAGIQTAEARGAVSRTICRNPADHDLRNDLRSVHSTCFSPGQGGAGSSGAEPAASQTPADTLRERGESGAAGPCLGWLGYEYGLALRGVHGRKPAPDVQGVLRRYETVLVHGRKPGLLEYYGRRPDLPDWTAERAPESGVFGLQGPAVASLSPQAYRAGVAETLEHIRQGWTYQLNLSIEFSAPASADRAGLAGELFRLFHAHPAAFYGLVHGSADRRALPTVLSTSPERFVRVDDGSVLSEPIKGTLKLPPELTPCLDVKRPIPQGESDDRDESGMGSSWRNDHTSVMREDGTPPEGSVGANESAAEETEETEEALRQRLVSSPKEDAELSMIVDLIRNDISSCCQYGSVRVERHKSVFRVDRLLQMYSEVHGRLAPPHTCMDLLLEAFPGGSVTGCPKVSSLHIIDELEPHTRGVYCGSLLAVLGPRHMDSSIAIRTAVFEPQGLQDGEKGIDSFVANPSVAEGNEGAAQRRHAGGQAAMDDRAPGDRRQGDRVPGDRGQRDRGVGDRKPASNRGEQCHGTGEERPAACDADGVVRGRYRYHAGSGIVVDSDPAAEYQETMAKAEKFLRGGGA